MNKSSKFHRLMQILAMFLCVAMVAGTFGTANASSGNNNAKTPAITISVPPTSIDYYNQNGEPSTWKPTFNITAKVQNVVYQNGMKLIFNWQEKHAGSDVFVDSPLIVDENHPENTKLSSEITHDAATSKYFYWGSWQNMNISLPISSADGKNVARNGAIFRCKIILVDKDNNEICSVMSNEVKVNYTVRVTLHDGEKKEDIKVPYNQVVTIPASYNQEGYTTGWQTREAHYDYLTHKTTYTYTDFDVTKGITAPVDLYVKRTKLVTVSFNMNGHGTQIPSQTFAAGQKAKEPAKPQATDGYEFVEWQDEKGNAYDFSKQVEENITLTAKWKTSKVSVTLYYNGHGYGHAPVVTWVEPGTTNVIPTNVVCTSPFAGTHKFIGWYTDPQFNSNQYTEPADGITSSVVLYAKWGTYYTVSFAAGKDFSFDQNADVPDSQDVEKDHYATVPTVTPKSANEGYEFAGWYEDITCTKEFKFALKKITSNTVVYAKFEKKPTVTVTLHANGHGNDDSTDTIYKGETYAVPAALTSDDTVHDTFLGWFTDKACTKAYDKATKLESNLDLYAGWKTEYTVKFDANGKTFVGSYGDQKVVKGNSITLPTNVTEDSDKYDFTGWTLNGESVSGDFTVNGDVTFVANWAAKLIKFELAGSAQNVYYVGDSFNPTGLKIRYTYADGTKKEYDVSRNNCDYDFSTAGSKTVAISYDGRTFNYDVTVKKNAGFVDVVTESISATYGDTPITILGEAASDTPVVTSGEEKVVKIENNKVVIVGVGTTDVTVSVGATDTHEAKTVTISVTISPKTLTVGWDEESLVLTYNGDKQAPKVDVEGILEGDIVNVTVSGAQKNVGDDYSAKVSVDNKNYVIAEEDAEQLFSIAPKTVEVIWTNTELIYDGTEQGPDAALTEDSIFEGDEVNVTVSNKAT